MGKTFIDKMMEEVEENRRKGVYEKNQQYRKEHPIRIDDSRLSEDAKKFVRDETLTKEEKSELFAKLLAKGEISHFTCGGADPGYFARYEEDEDNEN